MLCKSCDTLLVPGVTCTHRIRGVFVVIIIINTNQMHIVWWQYILHMQHFEVVVLSFVSFIPTVVDSPCGTF